MNKAPTRRRLLQGALAGASMVALPGGGLAQAVRGLSPAESAAARAELTTLGAPRQALVIGNDRYRDAPLKNPVNDARAIAAELEGADFAVSVLLDATLVQMRERVQAFARELARTKSVGLFYFAGHGIQLSWRNYLLPVDTVIQKMDEVRDKAVDLALLLEGIGKAGNPANIVILDACRNNPFGRDFRVEQRGLSQVDAPVGTLLAYATAPGNVAIDGEGSNGLYTEHLLREIRVPDAKVEDIFKRVRHAVRRASKGVQIPWESTSLDEDFYFQPPAQLRRAAEAERERRRQEEREAIRREEARQRQVEEELRAKRVAEAELERRLAEERAAALRAEEERHRKAAQEIAARQRAEAERRRELEEARAALEKDEAEKKRRFEEERAVWAKLERSEDLAALEEFAYRYPSGYFAEPARLRIDLLLARQGERRIETVNAPANPYTKGTGVMALDFKVGDAYAYVATDMLTRGVTGRVALDVTAVTDTEVAFGGGLAIFDKLGNTCRGPDGRAVVGDQSMVREYSLGRRWVTRYLADLPNGSRTEAEIAFRVVAFERVTVPAGTFECFRVDGTHAGSNFHFSRLTTFVGTTRYWVAPGRVRLRVASESLLRSARGHFFESERLELAQWRES